MWSKYVTRRLATQVAQQWNFGWGEAMKKVYGTSVKNTLVFRDQKKTEYYVDEHQYQKYVADIYALLQNQKFISHFHRDAQDTLEKILHTIQQKFLSVDVALLSNHELLELFQNFVVPNMTQFYIRMWTVFNIGEPLANVVQKELEKSVLPSKLNHFLLILSFPLKPNDVMHERLSILQLAVQKHRLSRAELQRRIAQHTMHYRHIPMFDFDHEPYTEHHFNTELRAIRNPSDELRQLRTSFRKRQKDFAMVIKKLKPSKQFKRLLYFLKETVYLRDYRDMIRQKVNLELRTLYGEIGKRLSLSVAQVATLTNEEIIKYLKNGRSFPKLEARKRAQAYLLIQKGGRVRIFSGNRAQQRARQELATLKLKNRATISGIIGSAGKASGNVRIVYTNQDLGKVRRGDILVTTMTRQDFITAIRKAAALVTDEGSVTCHAAIIARELNIPCIVATRIGTKVLRDGEKVFVDADTNGVVKRLT